MLKHIGVIMDGNRRWAKAHALETMQGHNKGAENFGYMCDWCLEENIPYMTVYAFSTENWQRTDTEKKHLFSLMEKYFTEEKENCVEKDIKITIIGERSRFSPKILSVIEGIEKATEHCRRLCVQIALSYGGRDEIIRAIKKLPIHEISNLTGETFEAYLDTAGTPDIDMVIRTGGEENQRLSNFLLWQTAYSELYFSKLTWPEFTKDEFKKALTYFNGINRKKGA